MNHIDEHRKWAAGFIHPLLKLDDECEIITSPNGKYHAVVDVYEQQVCDVLVTETRSGIEIGRFRRDDDRFWCCWIEQGGVEYLVCSEVLDGQTVVDLTHRTMESWCPSQLSSEQGFIWTGFSTSPSRQRLATTGCYWACPYELVVYDFSSPMRLPLPELARIDLDGFDLVDWESESAIRLRAADGTEKLFEFG